MQLNNMKERALRQFLSGTFRAGGQENVLQIACDMLPYKEKESMMDGLTSKLGPILRDNGLTELKVPDDFSNMASDKKIDTIKNLLEPIDPERKQKFWKHMGNTVGNVVINGFNMVRTRKDFEALCESLKYGVGQSHADLAKQIPDEKSYTSFEELGAENDLPSHEKQINEYLNEIKDTNPELKDALLDANKIIVQANLESSEYMNVVAEAIGVAQDTIVKETVYSLVKKDLIKASKALVATIGEMQRSETAEKVIQTLESGKLNEIKQTDLKNLEAEAKFAKVTKSGIGVDNVKDALKEIADLKKQYDGRNIFAKWFYSSVKRQNRIVNGMIGKLTEQGFNRRDIDRAIKEMNKNHTERADSLIEGMKANFNASQAEQTENVQPEREVAVAQTEAVEQKTNERVQFEIDELKKSKNDFVVVDKD